MKVVFDSQVLEITPSGRGYVAVAADQTVSIEVLRLDRERRRMDLLIDGRRVTAYVSSDLVKRWLTVNGRTSVLTKSSGTGRGGAGHDHLSDLAAPMPGQVRNVNVKVGEAVKKGQTLLVLEAMKMEIRVQAPRDGLVKSLYVERGETVDREQVLIEIEEAE